MEEELKQIVDVANASVGAVSNRADFEAFKAGITGPNGSLTKVMKSMGQVAKEDRPSFGKRSTRQSSKYRLFMAALWRRLKQLKLPKDSARQSILPFRRQTRDRGVCIR